VVVAFLELHSQNDKVHNMIEVVPMYHFNPMMNKDENLQEMVHMALM
jgi:hypothetical protein